MTEEKPSPKKRRRILFALAAAALWIVLAPNWITEWAVEKILMAKLNDPEAGVTCERVKFSGFRCWKLIFRRDPGELSLKGVRYRVKGLKEAGTVENDVVRLNLAIGRGDGDEDGRIAVSGGGNALDWGLSVKGEVDLAWTNLVSVAGGVNIALLADEEETPYGVDVDFDASAEGWRAHAHLPEFGFSGEDAVVGRLVSRCGTGAVSNLVFGGTASADFFVRRTSSMPVAAWTADASLRGVSASAEMGGTRYAVSGLSMRPSISGLAGHVDSAPLKVRARSLEAAGVVLTNVYADLRNDSKRLLVTEANAGICGGTASIYALTLDPEKLNAGFTLFVDDLDAGEVLSHISGFRGDATGRLHGRIPLRVREGLEVRLGDAFLYSTPGETGTLRLGDASLIVDNLAAGGIDAETRANVAKALADLEYKVLRLNLRTSRGGDSTLTIRLDGSPVAEKSLKKKTLPPVDITVNVNGPIESLLNFGIRASKIK